MRAILGTAAQPVERLSVNRQESSVNLTNTGGYQE
jgi:hypothetical protein